MIRFSNKTPTIAQIYQYTYQNPHTYNRFEYGERDIVKTSIKIIKRTSYVKNKEGKWSAPEEKLYVVSSSYPQYGEYLNVRTKGAKRQRKIKHTYNIELVIQNTPNGYSYFDSKIKWRVGSYCKWPKSIKQSLTKQVHLDTRKKLEKKYSKLPPKQKVEMIRREIERIRKHGKFVSDGDAISTLYGLNGDWYWRVSYLAMQNDCVIGRVYTTEPPKENIRFVFFDKHMIQLLNYLMKRGIIKYK